MHYACEPTHNLNGKVTLHSLTTQICHSSIWEVAGLNLSLDTDYLEAFTRFVVTPSLITGQQVCLHLLHPFKIIIHSSDTMSVVK